MSVTVIKFSQSLHSVDEGDGSVQLTLILNNPPSTDATISMLIKDESAEGEHYTVIAMICSVSAVHNFMQAHTQ